jgi:hypothetical protein
LFYLLTYNSSRKGGKWSPPFIKGASHTEGHPDVIGKPPTITYSRQNFQPFLLMIIRRDGESEFDPPLVSQDLDFLYEALDKRLSFRQFTAINKLTQIINVFSY